VAFISTSLSLAQRNIKMSMPDRDLFVKGAAFTKKNHRDVYAAIDPARPELSQAGKVVVITGATRGLGRLVSFFKIDEALL
jgi:hypothetical protein